MKFKRGAPLSYDPVKVYDQVIKAIGEVLVLGQVAGMVKVPRSTFCDWITRGDDDRKQGISSDLAHLSEGVRKAQAEEVKKLIAKIKQGRRGAGDAKWLLEKCFREDFGLDAGIIQELKAQLDTIEGKLMKYMDNPLQGGFRNGGQELDQGGNQKEGSAPESVGSEEGQANTSEEISGSGKEGRQDRTESAPSTDT